MTQFNIDLDEEHIKKAIDSFTKNTGYSVGIAKALFGNVSYSDVLIASTVLALTMMFTLWIIRRTMRMIVQTFTSILNILFMCILVLLGMHFYNIGLSATVVIAKDNAIQLAMMVSRSVKVFVLYAFK